MVPLIILFVQLTASWTDNSGGVATTRIERRLGADAAYGALADVPPGVTEYVDASVSPATTYCYRALAWDAEGTSPYSAEACAVSSSDGTVLPLAITKAGTGGGTVLSTPAGIECGPVCASTFTADTSVSLAATAAGGSVFDGWTGGGCAGTGTCIVAGNTPVAVTAAFSLVPVSLSVAKSGPGTVTSAPAGISCGADCSETYANATVVTLTATPNNGAAFTGWTGAGCTGGSPTCVVTLQAATLVTAAFRNGKRK